MQRIGAAGEGFLDDPVVAQLFGGDGQDAEQAVHPEPADRFAGVRRSSPQRERVTRCPYAVCSVPVPGSGPSSDRPGEHESGLVVDADGRTRFYRLVAVHDAPAVGRKPRRT